MQIIIKGRQMEVTPRLRQHIEQKVKRLSRLISGDARVEVTIVEMQARSNRDRYAVQLALSSHGSHPIHSEVNAMNVNAALDLVLDKVTTQLGRHKDRQTTTKRRHTSVMKVVSLSRAGDLSLMEEEQSDEGIKKIWNPWLPPLRKSVIRRSGR